MAEEALRLARPPVPRLGSGLAVADLLSEPSPITPRRRPSNPGGQDVYNSKPKSESGSPSDQTDTAKPATPTKTTPTANTQPVTPEGVNEGLTYQYPPVQQIVEGRENIEYILHIREQPKHSRMCGVGEKADRRPIDPAPIIQLRVVVHPKAVQPEGADDFVQKPSETNRSAAVSMSGQNSDSPIPHLRRGEPVTTSQGEGWEDKAWYLENPYYFMCAMLADAEKDDELHLLSDGKTRYTTGSCVSCLYHLKDIDGSHQGFFVFPDLSIRVEGRYRLKLCLFETIGNQVHHCKSIFSDPFMVYTAKRFPGMEESTRLSRSFADQGLKVRVRKNTRGKKGRGARPRHDQEDGSEGEDEAHRSSMMLEGSQKRLRSDSWLSTGSASDYSTGAGPSMMMNSIRDPRHVSHRPTSPISPQIGWSGPPPSGANYIAHRSIEPFHYPPHHGSVSSQATQEAARGRSLSLVEERALRSRAQHLPTMQHVAESAWHSHQAPRLPAPAGMGPGSSMGPVPSSERSLQSAHPAYRAHGSTYGQAPPPASHQASGVASPPHHSQYPGSAQSHSHQHPRSRPESPEAGWSGPYGQHPNVSRQRSFSSAASLAPRPWDHRPASHSALSPQRTSSAAGGSHHSSTQHSPASASAASSRPRSPSGTGSGATSHYRSSLAFNPPRLGSHGSHPRLSSQLAGPSISHHSRERSLSDPRKLFRPPPSAWGSPLPPLNDTSNPSGAPRPATHQGENGNSMMLPPLAGGDTGRRGEFAHFPASDSSPLPTPLPASRAYVHHRGDDATVRYAASMGERERVAGWQRDQRGPRP